MLGIEEDNEIKQEQQSNQPGLYAFGVLALCTMIRTAYIINKNSIGYAFGYEGIGSKFGDPKYMLVAAYPQLIPIYGIVASLMFSAAYSTSNVFMSSQSKNWNKKWMLALGAIGFSLTSLIAGGSNSLMVFALMRFCFGICASAINAPIYQMIATNFPPEYRTTANAIENSGYWLGAGLASFMVLIIKNSGWRAMYYTMGSFGIVLGGLTLAFVKNPVIKRDPEVIPITQQNEIAIEEDGLDVVMK